MDAGGGVPNPFAPPVAVDAPVIEARFRPPHGLALALAVALGLQALLDVTSALLFLRTVRAETAGLVGDEARTRLLQEAEKLSVPQLLFSLVVLVLYCLYVARANRNVRSFGISPLRYGPRWAALCVVVPIVNLWKPYYALKEIWQGTFAADSADATGWKRVPVPVRFPLWWSTFLLGGGVTGAATTVIRRATSTSSLTVGTALGVLGELITAASAVLIAGIVVRLARLQQDRQQRLAAVAVA